MFCSRIYRYNRNNLHHLSSRIYSCIRSVHNCIRRKPYSVTSYIHNQSLKCILCIRGTCCRTHMVNNHTLYCCNYMGGIRSMWSHRNTDNRDILPHIDSRCIHRTCCCNCTKNDQSMCYHTSNQRIRNMCRHKNNHCRHNTCSYNYMMSSRRMQNSNHNFLADSTGSNRYNIHTIHTWCCRIYTMLLNHMSSYRRTSCIHHML